MAAGPLTLCSYVDQTVTALCGKCPFLSNTTPAFCNTFCQIIAALELKLRSWSGQGTCWGLRAKLYFFWPLLTPATLLCVCTLTPPSSYQVQHNLYGAIIINQYMIILFFLGIQSNLNNETVQTGLWHRAPLKDRVTQSLRISKQWWTHLSRKNFQSTWNIKTDWHAVIWDYLICCYHSFLKMVVPFLVQSFPTKISCL